jgi:hypothetical protein
MKFYIPILFLLISLSNFPNFVHCMINNGGAAAIAAAQNVAQNQNNPGQNQNPDPQAPIDCKENCYKIAAHLCICSIVVGIAGTGVFVIGPLLNKNTDPYPTSNVTQNCIALDADMRGQCWSVIGTDCAGNKFQVGPRCPSLIKGNDFLNDAQVKRYNKNFNKAMCLQVVPCNAISACKNVQSNKALKRQILVKNRPKMKHHLRGNR